MVGRWSISLFEMAPVLGTLGIGFTGKYPTEVPHMNLIGLENIPSFIQVRSRSCSCIHQQIQRRLSHPTINRALFAVGYQSKMTRRSCSPNKFTENWNPENHLNLLISMTLEPPAGTVIFWGFSTVGYCWNWPHWVQHRSAASHFGATEPEMLNLELYLTLKSYVSRGKHAETSAPSCSKLFMI